jgi:hypothetical protein
MAMEKDYEELKGNCGAFTGDYFNLPLFYP